MLVEFDPSETGKSVVVDTSRDGQFFGRESVMIPPAGAPRECVIPMAFSAQRVVFIMAASRAAKSDHYLLAEAMASHIERLEPSQRFALLTASEDGVEAWPYEVAFETPTSEQKVRAFDVVRSIRPVERVNLGGLLHAAGQLDPTTVWVFADAVDQTALNEFAEKIAGRNVSINMVLARESAMDIWLDGFTARHSGVVTTLADLAPTVAMDDDALD